MKQKIFWGIASLILLVAVATGLWYAGRQWYKSQFEVREQEVHSMIVTEIERLGRLELIRYQMQDIVRYERNYPWWPDPKLTLMAYGEAIACIDLAALNPKDIVLAADTVFIRLPEPFICHVKLDHSRSAVVTSEWTFLEGPSMTDSAYKKAELQIQKRAYETPIREEAKAQAVTLLRPLLERLAQRPVKLTFQGDQPWRIPFETPQ